MAEILSDVVSVSVAVFAVASMASVGLAQSPREILAPLRNVRAVARALVANFILVPLLAFALVRALPLDRSLEIGLLLVGAGAGAPFLIKLAVASESDVELSGTLLVLLLPMTILYMPIVVPLLLPEADVSAAAIATPLVLTMLLPLAAGLAARATSTRQADRTRPILGAVSTVALVTLVVSTFAANLGGIVEVVGTGAILAAALVVGGAFAVGYLLGGQDREARAILGLGTGQRNIAAATVVATQTVRDPGTLVMVVIASLVGLAILFPIAWAIRRQTQGGKGAWTRPTDRTS